MLNARLYRTCWLVAGVALVVALLTLETPGAAPEPAVPSTIDGQGTLELAGQFASIAPERAPGSAPDLAAAQWIRQQLAQIPGASRRVQVQDLEARVDGEPLALQNVYLVVPGTGGGLARGGVLVVAPRDTPAGVSAGASSTAVLLRLARSSATTRHQRPHLFVSAGGSSTGDAGIRWFLERFSSFPISAAIVLDAPGEANGDRVHIWDQGRTDRHAIGFTDLAERSVERAGGRPAVEGSLSGELLRLAVPQTFGAQGAIIRAGIPAVTLAGRSESPLREGRPATAERLELVANAANDLLGVVDAAETVPAADGAIGFAGRVLRPTIARLALLLLALPVLVLTIDIVARQRRGRLPLGDGLRAVGLRALPLLVALAAGHLLVLAGVLPGAAAGVPPIPADVRIGPLEGLGVALALAAGALAWLAARRRARRLRVPAAAEATAALAALSALLVLMWVLIPFALALALPAAHAALLATAARRPWQLVALGAVAVIPLLGLVAAIAGLLDSGAPFAVWYLAETSVSGARGGTGVLLGALVAACVWALVALVVRRRLGGWGGRDGAGARRPRRRRPIGPTRRVVGRPDL